MRARLAHLFDDGAMVESGMHARSARAEVRDKSPADGKVAGFGKVDGRWVAAMSNDFTVMGASSALINGKKMRHLKETANTQGMPLIWMGESTGARMPDRMGASGRAILGSDAAEYRRLRETLWVAVQLGDMAWVAHMVRLHVRFCRDEERRGDGGSEPACHFACDQPAD